MTLASNLRFHDYQFGFTTPTGSWRWTTRLDVTLSNPSYSIRDIVSPIGLLRDSIPIPGDIIKAMSDSIDDLKANFAPTILMASPLTFSVDEGRGLSLPQSVLVTNSGVYGSLLGVTLTPSAGYILVSPAQVGNLAKNETGSFNVSVDSTTLLASSSPIAGSISVQDPTATNNPITYGITINIRPKATLLLSVGSLSFSVVKPLSGAFPSIPTQTFQVTNTGASGSVLAYSAQKLIGLSDWLTSFIPATGSLNSGVSQTITVTVAPPDNMMAGTYTETLRVSGYSSNLYQDIQIQLVIS